MRIAKSYSHLNGYEYLVVHKPYLWDEIQSVIESVDAEACKTKISKEKRMKGKRLFSPKALNTSFKTAFQETGWREERTSYWVTGKARALLV